MGDDPMDLFSEACGLIGPLRPQLEWPGQRGPSVFEFRRPFLVVGRDGLSDVPIDLPEVSRRHAYFQVVAGRVFCIDLCSRTGVHWDDGARPLGWIDRGRGVKVGPVRVHFDGDDAGSAGQGDNLPISRSFDWPAPDARLEFLGPESGREPYQVRRSLVLLGRSPTCRVRLLGAGIGNIHVALIRTPGGIWAVDLHGPEGMIVGGAPVRCARLEDGDEITLGDQRLRIRVGPVAVQTSGRSDLARVTSGRSMQASSTDADRSNRSTSGQVVEPWNHQGRSDGVDSVTARLLEKFDRMHQQTTEQFQQALVMMFRMHQDQMEVIRDGLARIDRLENEQRALRDEMAREILRRPPRSTLRLVSGESMPSPTRPDDAESARILPEPARSPGWIPFNAPVLDDLATSETNPPAGNQPTGGVPPLTTEPFPHARLAQRIAEIQDERQGLWRRIMASLAGDGSGRGLP